MSRCSRDDVTVFADRKMDDRKMPYRHLSVIHLSVTSKRTAAQRPRLLSLSQINIDHGVAIVTLARVDITDPDNGGTDLWTEDTFFLSRVRPQHWPVAWERQRP
jgi:hypothetical protein